MCTRAAAELRDLPDRPDAIRVMTRHHLVPQHWFRKNPEWKHLMNCDANVVPLCRMCHDLVELPAWKGGQPYRRELRRMMTQAEISFVIQVRGLDWLEQTYPRVAKTEILVELKPKRRSKRVEAAKRYGDIFDLWLEMYGAGGKRASAGPISV